MCIYSNTSDGQNSLRVSSNSAIRLNFEWNPTLLVFVCLFVSLNLNQVNSSRPLSGPRTTFWKPLFERASHSPSGPWPSLPHPNPTDEPAKLQLLCVGIYARLQLAETPSRSRLSDQTIAALQVLTPVTWGFTFANRRLSLQLSEFSLPHCRRTSDSAVLQMLPQCSSQWDELPKLHRHPHCATGSITHCLQCNGVIAALVMSKRF